MIRRIAGWLPGGRAELAILAGLGVVALVMSAVVGFDILTHDRDPLVPPPGTLLPCAPAAYSVAGLVVDARTGEPVAGAEVRLVAGEPLPAVCRQPADHAPAMPPPLFTSAAGRFSATIVATSEQVFHLEITAPSYAALRTPGFTAPYGRYLLAWPLEMRSRQRIFG